MDALCCGSNYDINIARSLYEIQRVIKTSGFFQVISYGAPDTRVHHFERPHQCFEIEKQTIDCPLMEEPVDAENEEDKTIHWCYIMIKKFEAELKTKDDLLEVEIEIMKKSLYEDFDS